METETITVKMSETHTDWEINREALGEITPENICECSEENQMNFKQNFKSSVIKRLKTQLKNILKNMKLKRTVQKNKFL